MAAEVRVPTLGESISEATVGSWFKSIGDQVATDEMICELETDKVSIEVPSPASGTLQEILVNEGDTVGVDALLATVSVGAIEAQPDAPPAKEAKPVKTTAPPVAPPVAARDTEDAPSAKKMMADHGIPAGRVQGTGRDDRRMKEDVQRTISAAAAAGAATKVVPESVVQSSNEERVTMTRLRRTIARRLKEAQNTAAMLTTYNEADMSNIMAFRAEYRDVFLRKHGVKLGFMSFFVKACCTALIEIPEVNAEVDGNDVVYRNFVNMGIAVGTPTGLVVPVLRNAHNMKFHEIEQTIGQLGRKARNGKLSIGDMQGGTFSISNGGVYGSLMSSPILNPPQSGILGMHKIQDRPIAMDGEVVIRPMMYLALSYDHRIVDGQGAVTFLVRVKEAIEDPRRLLLEI